MRSKKKLILLLITTVTLIIGCFIADTLLFSGIKSKTIKKNDFQANYFIKDTFKDKTAVILIGGGQWGDFWGEEFANRDIVGLSLPYTGKEGLPGLPEEIDLEYFENAIQWLSNQKEVDDTKIIVMGASRNAELALVIASTFTETIHGVIAYAPSAVSWSNTVLPYNSDELKPSWKYKGVDIPYIPMEKISGNESNRIKMLDYWKDGLAKKDIVDKASIKVERINGPILLFSGNDDKVWPSSLMANMIEKRLIDTNFEHLFENIKYDNSGHLISSDPESKSSSRTGIITIDEKDYSYEFGGNDIGDFKAKQRAKIKLLEFLEKF